jgi:hypothetical protein
MWAFVVSSLVLSASPEMVARTLDGREVAGTVSELSGGRVVLNTGEKSVTIEAGQIVSLKPRSASRASDAKPIRVELVDGSRVAAAGDFEFDAKDGQVTLTLRDYTLVGPAKGISIAHLKPETSATKSAWDGFRAKHKAKGFKGDALVVTKGDTVDHFEGVLYDTATNKDAKKIIKFEHEDSTIEVLLERIDGIIYLGTEETEPADPVCILSDADGSVLRLKSLVLKDGNVEFETQSGFKASRPLELLAGLDFSAGKIAYLGGDHEAASDELAPLRKPVFQSPVPGTKPLPSVLEWTKPRSKNRVLPDDKLRVNGHVQPFERGLYLRGGWELEYALRGRFRRFQTIAGIDVSNERGRAELVVEGDGKELFRGLMQQGGPAKALDLDVSQVRILKIRAIRQGALDGIIDLCDARVTK